MDELIRTVRDWIRSAERIVVLTGAGISTDSGIPDFVGRKVCGRKTRAPKRWQRCRTMLPTPKCESAPGRAASTRSAKSGGRTPATTRSPSSSGVGSYTPLITQNVDGLHLAAGHSPQRVVEIHGTVREVVCLDCGERAPMERALARVRAGDEDPACRSCGGILKSATISFGQGLVVEDLRRAESPRGL